MDRISVILPSRGRWEALQRALASLTAGGDAEVEVLVGLDEDDPASEAAFVLETYPGVRPVVAPLQQSVGALFNLLAKESTGDWLIPFPDDYVMMHPDWAERLRDGVKRLPCALGVAYLKDLLYPGFTTFPVVSRRMIELNGFFMPEFFPFLFGDTWWNEVGNLTGVKQQIDARVLLNMNHGTEHRYRDFVLWARLFERTRPMRVQTAIKAIEAIYAEHGAESSFLISTMPQRAAMCEANQRHMFDDSFVGKWDNTDPRAPTARYSKLREAAQAFLLMNFEEAQIGQRA
jgi:hypothetical protein